MRFRRTRQHRYLTYAQGERAVKPWCAAPQSPIRQPEVMG